MHVHELFMCFVTSMYIEDMNPALAHIQTWDQVKIKLFFIPLSQFTVDANVIVDIPYTQ